MKKILPFLTLLLLALFIAGCASVPKGFDEAEKAALEAKAESDSIEASKDMPLEYEAAESVLKTAQEKKEAKDYKTSMSLYQEAEQKYSKLNKTVKTKRELDQYMIETTPYVDSVESRINKADKKK